MSCSFGSVRRQPLREDGGEQDEPERERREPEDRVAPHHAASERTRGIERGVGEVDQQVHGHEDQRDHQHHALHHREVPVEDRLDHEPPDARPREDGLRHHRAAQELGELQAEQGHDRDRGVLERVGASTRGLGQALGPRGPHVVLAQHLEHARAHQAGQPPEDDGRQAHRGKHQVGEGAAAVDGQPAQVARRRRR